MARPRTTKIVAEGLKDVGLGALYSAGTAPTVAAIPKQVRDDALLNALFFAGGAGIGAGGRRVARTAPVKAASEFGLTKKQNLAALLMLISDVHAVGLNTAQGLYLTEGWYWNMNDESRKWASRFEATMKRKPNSNHASVYSSTLHYLNAVKAAGTDDTAAVMKKMRETPINDMFAKGGKLREDGRMVHDMYLFQVKTPAESKGPWDYYNLKGTVKGEDAFQSIAAGKCAAAKK